MDSPSVARATLSALAASPFSDAVALKGGLALRHVYGSPRETDDQIATRLDRAEMELGHASDFDTVVVNDDLDTAVAETVAAVRAFLESRGV